MIGSTIVFIPVLPKNKATLFKRIIETEEYETIYLEGLTTLDFSIMTMQEGTNWNAPQNPVVYNEKFGLVITHIDQAGLQSVLDFTGELENIDTETQQSDIEQLRSFADLYGTDRLYELVAF
jgi:S-adenosylmethionine hydrolase